MPNYVTNIIKMDGPSNQIEKVLDYLLDDQDNIDFNKIIPMPEDLNVTSGSYQNEAIALYHYKVLHNDALILKILEYPWVANAEIHTVDELCEHLLENRPDLLDAGEKYVKNIELYGCPTWYEWCNTHWGTKWNAMRSWYDTNSFGFETAWASVPDLMIKLSERFGDITFTYSYADEDYGSNLGRFVFFSGDVIDEYFPEQGSDEAYDLVSEIMGFDVREEWEEDEEDIDEEEIDTEIDVDDFDER